MQTPALVTIEATDANMVADTLGRVYRSVTIEVTGTTGLTVAIPATVADVTYYLRELIGTLVTMRLDGRIVKFSVRWSAENNLE
jgi:hypothetical protein